MKPAIPVRTLDSSQLLKAKRTKTSMQTSVGSNKDGLYLALLTNGQRYMRDGKYREAAKSFEQVLKDLPDNVEANYSMAQLSSKLDATRHAVDYMRRALKLGSGNHQVQMAMAEVCLAQGYAAEAQKHIDLALKLNPNDEQAPILKARIVQQLGLMSEAFILAKTAIQKNPMRDDAITVYASSAKFKGDEPELELIEKAYRSKPNPKRLNMLGYSLGKIYNDAKQYDKAFAYFKSGADTYDVKNISSKMEDETKLMRQAFTADFIEEKRKNGHKGNQPIFVVGMPRSGTTLTEQILASHPHVYGVGESMAMSRINRMVSMGGGSKDAYLSQLEKIDQKKQYIFGENYLNTLANFGVKSKHYVDKMPSNFFLVGLINIIFPNAKIIHCTRDAIDNCVSCYTSPLNESHLYAKDLKTLGQYYREYHSLMNYWKSVSAIPIFEMKYEDTVADLEGRARALIQHVGLPWDDACLKFNEAKSQVSTISKWQVRQPIYSTSVKRWKVYEKHLGPLIEALGDLAVTD